MLLGDLKADIKLCLVYIEPGPFSKFSHKLKPPVYYSNLYFKTFHEHYNLAYSLWVLNLVRLICYPV